MLCVHNLLSAPQYVSEVQLHPKLGSKPPWCLGRVHGAQLTESLSNTATNTSIRHGDTRPPRHQIATGHARRTLEPRHPNIHMHQSIKTPKLQAIEKQTANEQNTKTDRHIDNVKSTNRQTDKRNRCPLFFSLSLPFVVPAFHLLYLKKTLQCNNLCEHNNLPHNV